MKIITTIALTAFSILAFNGAFAQKKVKEDSITVYGNCEQCKERIEASLDLSGVKYANWNMKTKKLFVAYKSAKISEEDIHKAVAGVGHDTDKLKAEDSVYVDLSFCCLYRDGNPHGPNGEEHGTGHKENHAPDHHRQHNDH